MLCASVSAGLLACVFQVIERVVEDISYHAPERAGETYTIDKEVHLVLLLQVKTSKLDLFLSF